MTPREPGNRRAWVLSVLEEHEARLTRFAARLLGDDDAARDVVQHAFLRLCDESPNRLRDRVAPWLFTVCRNRAVDMLRAQKRTGPLEKLSATSGVSKEPDPAVAVEKQELYRRLGRLVAELPANQREALDLWAEGFANAEIAEITGHSEGNVRVLVHRALKTLRRHCLARQLLDEAAETSWQRRDRPAESV